MKKVAIALVAAGVLAGCATHNNGGGEPKGLYQDPAKASQHSGIGIESNDIVMVTDKMIQSMLKSPALADRATPPRVVIDSQFFVNESTSRINKKLLTDRLRVELNRAAKGKMVFVGREYAGMVQQERELKRDGMVDAGTIRTTQATAGADFRLGGRISSLDAQKTDSQIASRYHQIVFEMVDLELGTIVWNDLYEFKKQAQDNVLYR